MTILTIIILLVIGLIGFLFLSLKFKSDKEVQVSLYQLTLNKETPAVTIDGKMEDGEWESFKWHDVYRKEKEMTVYLTNDNQNLYIAIDAIKNVTEKGFRDKVVFCFLPENSLKIEVGKFKTIEILGNGQVLWEEWNEIEKLSVQYVWKTEVYSANLSARLGDKEAIRTYDGKYISNVAKEKSVYAIFAKNIADIPDGLVAKTYFQDHRTYEIKIPLSSLGFQPGKTVRIFGFVRSATSKLQDLNFPNGKTGSLASSFWSTRKITLP